MVTIIIEIYCYECAVRADNVANGFRRSADAEICVDCRMNRAAIVYVCYSHGATELKTSVNESIAAVRGAILVRPRNECKQPILSLHLHANIACVCPRCLRVIYK